MSKGNFVSPNEMLQAGKDMMLEGREPESSEDWQKLVNFVAVNTMDGCEEAVCRLFAMLYSVPLSTEQVQAIAQFQVRKKAEKFSAAITAIPVRS